MGFLIGIGVLVGLYSGYQENALFKLAKSTYSELKTTRNPDAAQGCNFSLKQFDVIVDGKTDYFCFDDNPGSKNLIVNLHTWSRNASDGGDKFLFEYAQNKGADFVLPNLGGHNRNADACGSDWSIRSLDRVISKLKLMNGLEYEKVIVVGGSGGGFTALNHMLRGEQSADHYISINPITSLKTWFQQSKNTGRIYADDIIACTNDLEFAEKRSPISYAKNIGNFKGEIFLYHGLFDGYEGPVSAVHSINFWNSVNPTAQIPATQIKKILSLDTPDSKEPLEPLFTFPSEFGEFVLFKGGHVVPNHLILGRLNQILK